MRIGAHMSVAGGVSKAVDRAVVHGCEALQIFTKNANQWRGKPLDRAEIAMFRQRIEQTGITPVVSHASYLINLATTFPVLREQSIAAFIDELDRADALGLFGVVIHPGTCTAGPDNEALRLIADAIRMASTNPAKLYGLKDRGSIEVGRRADLILFKLVNNKIEIQKTVVAGKEVYSR